MKMTRRVPVLVIVAVLLVQLIAPAYAASSPQVFSRELFGYAGNVYEAAGDSVPMRESPSKNAAIEKRLEKNEPVECIGVYVTSAQTNWVKTYERTTGQIGWIYLGNLKSHIHCYIDLGQYGYEGFSFCSDCGHVIRTVPGEINMDQIHLALAVMSMIPGIGNGFDVLDSLLCIVEGDYAQAAIGFAAALPLLGAGFDALQTGSRAAKVYDNADLVLTATRVEKGLELTSTPSSAILRRNMQSAFLQTPEERFYDLADYVLPGRSVAAHHIVAGTASDAAEARGYLKAVGIDINDAENGVFLCMKSDLCEGAIHAGGHSSAYYESVNSQLRDAFNSGTDLASKREKITEALDQIANDLIEGKLGL